MWKRKTGGREIQNVLRGAAVQRVPNSIRGDGGSHQVWVKLEEMSRRSDFVQLN